MFRPRLPHLVPQPLDSLGLPSRAQPPFFLATHPLVQSRTQRPPHPTLHGPAKQAAVRRACAVFLLYMLNRKLWRRALRRVRNRSAWRGSSTQAA
jgi:hypothetical protein